MSAGVAREMMDSSSLTTLVQMVGAGIGVTLIPQMAVAIETRTTAVSVARLPAPRPTRTIGLVWRRTNPMRDQFATLIDIVKTAAS
jgi:LysR family transcriptional regulator, hydrogen peroxide-inducible genes activator